MTVLTRSQQKNKQVIKHTHVQKMEIHKQNYEKTLQECRQKQQERADILFANEFVKKYETYLMDCKDKPRFEKLRIYTKLFQLVEKDFPDVYRQSPSRFMGVKTIFNKKIDEFATALFTKSTHIPSTEEESVIVDNLLLQLRNTKCMFIALH